MTESCFFKTSADVTRETSLKGGETARRLALESNEPYSANLAETHASRSHCGRNFTGYIDKRAGWQVGQFENGNGRGRLEKKRAIRVACYPGYFSCYILFYLKLTKWISNDIGSSRHYTSDSRHFRSSANIPRFLSDFTCTYLASDSVCVCVCVCSENH